MVKFLSWLKCDNENTKDEKERLFNDELRSARLVTENCHGMLKCRVFFPLQSKILMKNYNYKIQNIY